MPISYRSSRMIFKLFIVAWGILVGYDVQAWAAVDHQLPSRIHTLILVVLATGTIISAICTASAWVSAEVGLARRLGDPERTLRSVPSSHGIIE